MAITRSYKTFEDKETFQVLKQKSKNAADLPVDNQSDSDEAPEEESMSVGKARIIEQTKAKNKILKDKREAAKQKHKEIEEKRKLAKLEKELKELEKQRKELNNIIDEIPDELPEDLLENLEVPSVDSPPMRQKIVFNDSEENKKIETVNKRKIREERLKKLRELRQNVERQVEGGINVKVLNNDSLNTIKSENLKKKNSWLMRKRIRRE